MSMFGTISSVIGVKKIRHLATKDAKKIDDTRILQVGHFNSHVARFCNCGVYKLS